jgi:hypothetical protein
MIFPAEEDRISAAIAKGESKLSEIVELMRDCPFTAPADRLEVLLGIMSMFEDQHFEMVAALAIERLYRLSIPNGVIGDVANGEEFLIRLMAGLIMAPKWAENGTREEKINAMARGVFVECTREQLALLVAVAMMRLIEGGQGPAE